MQLKVTVTYNTPAVPSQTKGSAMLVCPWSTSQSKEGALLPGCAGTVHCVSLLPSDRALHFPWVAVECTDWDGHVSEAL